MWSVSCTKVLSAYANLEDQVSLSVCADCLWLSLFNTRSLDNTESTGENWKPTMWLEANNVIGSSCICTKTSFCMTCLVYPVTDPRELQRKRKFPYCDLGVRKASKACDPKLNQVKKVTPVVKINIFPLNQTSHTSTVLLFIKQMNIDIQLHFFFCPHHNRAWFNSDCVLWFFIQIVSFGDHFEKSFFVRKNDISNLTSANNLQRTIFTVSFRIDIPEETLLLNVISDLDLHYFPLSINLCHMFR